MYIAQGREYYNADCSIGKYTAEFKRAARTDEIFSQKEILARISEFAGRICNAYRVVLVEEV